jgi:hypothetical protein
MTEELWLAWADPKPMLRYLIGTDEPRVQDVGAFPDCRTSDRKLRLFACACYHRIGHVLPHPVARSAVHVAERFADGLADLAEFQHAETQVRELANALEAQWRASWGAERIALQPTHAALALAGVVCWRKAPKAAYYASSNAYLDYASIMNPRAGVSDPALGKCSAAEARAQCGLIRDIFGNPFRPVECAAEWRTDTAVSLARQMYESREFSAMPILADALQDAGCDNDDMLNHCRGSGPHVRGCWVVDLVLGKE